MRGNNMGKVSGNWITAAFFVPPMGVIDPTVLTAFGEILTFAGAVIGIDYKHRINNDKT